MDYRHTQFGPPLLRFGVLAFLIAIGVISAVTGSWTGVATVAVTGLIVATAMFVFSRFTVDVTQEVLIASFGWGWPRRVLRWEEASAVRAVRNRWWYGFGIRWFPGGILWNVWGLDAVEFDLVKGGKLRIGTDEPDALLAAVVGRVPTG
jgi:hypothetical protein